MNDIAPIVYASISRYNILIYKWLTMLLSAKNQRIHFGA